MAMTRKEKAEMMAAIEKAELLAALRWTSPVERDVAPPESSGEGRHLRSATGHNEGWDFNSYSKKAFRAWSDSFYHGSGERQTGSFVFRGSVWLFSTKKRALAAMRHEIETKSARELLEIDRMLKEDDECNSIAIGMVSPLGAEREPSTT